MATIACIWAKREREREREREKAHNCARVAGRRCYSCYCCPDAALCTSTHTRTYIYVTACSAFPFACQSPHPWQRTPAVGPLRYHTRGSFHLPVCGSRSSNCCCCCCPTAAGVNTRSARGLSQGRGTRETREKGEEKKQACKERYPPAAPGHAARFRLQETLLLFSTPRGSLAHSYSSIQPASQQWQHL